MLQGIQADKGGVGGKPFLRLHVHHGQAEHADVRGFTSRGDTRRRKMHHRCGDLQEFPGSFWYGRVLAFILVPVLGLGAEDARRGRPYRRSSSEWPAGLILAVAPSDPNL